jgi:hypothetical protein
MRRAPFVTAGAAIGHSIRPTILAIFRTSRIPRVFPNLPIWPALSIFFRVLAVGVSGHLLLACGSSGADFPRAAASGGQTATAQPDDSDLPSLLPPELKVEIDVNLEILRNSLWTAEALKSQEASERATKIAALGYDDATDVDRMEYAVTALDGSRPTLVVAQGRFVAATVVDAFRMRWPGATVETRRGVPISVNGENALAFVTPKTFASGAPGDVRVALDRAYGVSGGGGGDFGLGALRRDLGGSIPGVSPAVLAVSVIDPQMRARLGDVFSMPSAITHFGVRMDLGRSLTLTALVLAKDRPAAAQLAHQLTLAARETRSRLILAAVGLSPILNNLDVATDGARVRITSMVDEADRAEIRQALQALLRLLRAQ